MKRRYLLFILLISLLLGACASSETTVLEADHYAQSASFSDAYAVTPKGTFYTKNAQLHFFDNDKGTSYVVCSLPHCRHERKQSTAGEKTCEAFIPMASFIEVVGGKLFVMTESIVGDKPGMVIVESKLDRSEQVTWQSFIPGSMMSLLAISQEKPAFYATLLDLERDEDAYDELQKVTGNATCRLAKITADRIDFIEPALTDYLSGFTLIGRHDNKIVLVYRYSLVNYYKNGQMNLDLADPKNLRTDWYVVDIESQDMVLERLASVQGHAEAVHMSEEKIYFVLPDNSSGAEKKRAVYRFTLDDPEPFIIIDNVGTAFFVNDTLFYETGQGTGHRINLESNEEAPFPAVLSALTLIRSNGRQIRASRRQSNGGAWEDILLNAADLESGKADSGIILPED